MKKVMKWLRKSQKGQTATEYILILGVIVVGLIIAAHRFIEPFTAAVDDLGTRVKACVSSGQCNFG